MKIIITESQYRLLVKESMIDDTELRNTIKSFESTVTDSKGNHYVFDDKDPKNPKTFVNDKSKRRGGTLTIGWGHTGDKAKIGNKISNSEAERLLSNDIKNEENKTKILFPKYDTYPSYVQRALVNSVYRGEAKSTYEWVKLINSGNWDLAAKKYLEGWDIDFSKAKDPRYKGGVADRMTKNQEAFKKYSKEVKIVKPEVIKKQPTIIKQTKKQNNSWWDSAKKNIENMVNSGNNTEHLWFDSVSNAIKKSAEQLRYYTVKPGDSLSKIASMYKDKTITANSIKKLNNLKSDNITVGQKLKIK